MSFIRIFRLRSTAKGTTVEGDVTSTNVDADRQALDVFVRGGTSVGLTDAQLRATPVPVSVSGVSTAANQTTANTSLNNLDVDLGARADVSATTDTGTFSLISLFKRLLEKFTILNLKDFATQTTLNTLLKPADTLTKVTTVDTITNPVIIADGGGSITVDGPVTDAQIRATPVPVSVSGVATAANQTTLIGHVDGIEALLTSIDADTDVIRTSVQLLDNAISGNEMQVDVITMPIVTVQDGGGSITVDGPVTDAQLRATPLPISGSVTANVTTTDPLLISFDHSMLSAFGTFETGELTPVIQSDFVYGLNNQVWNAGVVNGAGATVDVNGGRLRLQSGTANGGYAYITSRKIIKYRAGQGSVVRLTPIFTTGVANNIQIWGAGEVSANQPLNGYFFGFNGTVFGIFHYNNSAVPTFIPQSTWFHDKVDGTGASGFNWNVTVGTPVMIKYPYLGYGNIKFYVQNSDTSGWIHVHTIKYANTTASTQLGNPSLQVMGYTANTAAVANRTMFSGSVAAFISGQRSLASFPHYATSNRKTGVSTLTNILTLRTASTYNGVANRGLISFKTISMAWEGVNDTALLTMYLNATLGGVPSYTPINGSTADNGVTITSGNSMASVDVAGTTITGGIQVWNCVFSRNSQMIVDLSELDLFIEPNSTITFGVTGVASAEARVAVNWVEEL